MFTTLDDRAHPTTLTGDALSDIASTDFAVPLHGDRPMRSIAIVGTTGSGKSVLSEQLASALSIPAIELDALFWMPDWQPALIELFRFRVETATSGCLPMCGHGTIGTVTMALENGLMTPAHEGEVAQSTSSERPHSRRESAIQALPSEG